MKKSIYISIVIPTRNRPECIEMCLETIRKQTLTNFEVIVSDNSNEKGCRDIVEKFHDDRIKYYQTDGMLTMRDSFEFAVKKATGNNIMLLNDKNLLYHDALEKLQTVLENNDIDVLNFPMDFFSPYNSGIDITNGMLVSPSKTCSINNVDLNIAIKKHFSCDYLYLSSTGKDFQIGSILGGLYSKEFIDRLIEVHACERIFVGAVPDRYAAIEAVCISDKIYYIDDNICIYNSCGRNTWGGAQKKGYKELISQFVAPTLNGTNHDYLIIDGVHASLANILATDYYFAQKDMMRKGKFIREEECNIDRAKVAILAEDELHNNHNLTHGELIREKEKLNHFVASLNEKEKLQYMKYKNEKKTFVYKKNKKMLQIKAHVLKIAAYWAKRENATILKGLEYCFRIMTEGRYFTRDIREIL